MVVVDRVYPHSRVRDWAHMFDVYPEHIIQSGMAEAWRRAPVSMEICGTMLSWRDKQGYGEFTKLFNK